MGIILFIVPFMFVYQPVLILQDIQAVELATAIITSLAGVIAISGGFQRYVLKDTNPIESVLLIAAGFMLLYPENITDAVGLILFILIVGRQFFSLKKGGKVNAV